MRTEDVASETRVKGDLESSKLCVDKRRIDASLCLCLGHNMKRSKRCPGERGWMSIGNLIHPCTGSEYAQFKLALSLKLKSSLRREIAPTPYRDSECEAQ